MSRFGGNQRISALKRLGSSTNVNNARSSSGGSEIRDARQLLTRKGSTALDARQLIVRQRAATASTSDVAIRNQSLPRTGAANKMTDRNGKLVVVTGLKDLKMQDGKLVTNPATSLEEQKKKKVLTVGSSTLVTIRNPTSSNVTTNNMALTKTITNANVTTKTIENRLSTNEKFAVSFVNDKFEKQTSAIPKNNVTTSEAIRNPKKLHDASIQTARAPIRTNSQQITTSRIQTNKRALSDDEDNNADEYLDVSHDEFYEPPVKRASVAIRKINREEEQDPPSSSSKRVTTAPIQSRLSSNKTKPVVTETGTILVTNLQPSVTQDDVIELFEQCGQIVEITTLSQGCVQIIYSRREYAEQAVADYHNRLLDGQLMYVSCQQAKALSTKKASTSEVKTNSSNSGQLPKDSGTPNQPSKPNNSTTTNSNKIVIDPNFMREALFHPTNNSTNPVQFQVKL